LPVLKATFPSSLVFSAIFKISCGSSTGLGVCGGDVVGGDVVGGDAVRGGVSAFEPDPDALLVTKMSQSYSFLPPNLSEVTYRWYRLGQTWRLWHWQSRKQHLFPLPPVAFSLLILLSCLSSK
jgi:hypothetical protein